MGQPRKARRGAGHARGAAFRRARRRIGGPTDELNFEPFLFAYWLYQHDLGRVFLHSFSSRGQSPKCTMYMGNIRSLFCGVMGNILALCIVLYYLFSEYIYICGTFQKIQGFLPFQMVQLISMMREAMISLIGMLLPDRLTHLSQREGSKCMPTGCVSSGGVATHLRSLISKG